MNKFKKILAQTILVIFVLLTVLSVIYSVIMTGAFILYVIALGFIIAISLVFAIKHFDD